MLSLQPSIYRPRFAPPPEGIVFEQMVEVSIHAVHFRGAAIIRLHVIA
jgi:hypothetical protein